MTTLAVQFYDVVVWLHISAVVLAFGPTFAFGIYLATTGRNHPRSIPAVLEAQDAVNRSHGHDRRDRRPAVRASTWRSTAGLFDEVFVAVGIIAILVLLGLVHGFFLPNDRRALDAAKRDIERPGPARSSSARSSTGRRRQRPRRARSPA